MERTYAREVSSFSGNYNEFLSMIIKTLDDVYIIFIFKPTNERVFYYEKDIQLKSYQRLIFKKSLSVTHSLIVKHNYLPNLSKNYFSFNTSFDFWVTIFPQEKKVHII